MRLIVMALVLCFVTPAQAGFRKDGGHGGSTNVIKTAEQRAVVF